MPIIMELANKQYFLSVHESLHTGNLPVFHQQKILTSSLPLQKHVPFLRVGVSSDTCSHKSSI